MAERKDYVTYVHEVYDYLHTIPEKGFEEFKTSAFVLGELEKMGFEDIKSGEVTEVFACGTAAIITPIGRFKSETFDVTVADGGSGEFTLALRNQLLGIQLGEIEDPHNWMWKVC